MPSKPSPTRLRYNKLIFAGLKALSWSKDGAQFQGLLQGAGASKKADGSFSMSSLGVAKLMMIFDALKKAGFKPKSKSAASGASDWRKPRIDKITAIWIQLHDEGVMFDRSEKAMMKFCAAITGKAKLQWVTSHDLNRCIEVLKDKAKHAGVKLRD